MAPDTDNGDSWAWAAMEPELTPRERELRDRFVVEYLKDRDSTAAASRVGFQNGFAKEYGVKFLGEAYVQKRIKEIEEAPVANPKQEEQRVKLLTKRMLESMLVDQRLSTAARVSAARELSAIYGWHAPIKTQQTVTHQGGVMMVPAIADLSEWEAAAAGSQEKLVADART